MKEFITISSRDNPVIKQINALKSSADKRKKEGLFAIEGLRQCEDAFDNNVHIVRLIVTKEAYLKHTDIISKFSEKSDICNIVQSSLMDKISDTKSPQGIIMIVRIPEKFDDIKSGEKRYIALENIQDPSNLGAITRTAEALGFGGIILSSGGCDPYNPKALRASMGTLLRMPLFITDDIADFCLLKGLNLVACVVDNTAEDIKNHKFSKSDVVLIGNEANGIKDETLKKCKTKVTIKMTGSAESLNAAAAAAIAMWESIR